VDRGSKKPNPLQNPAFTTIGATGFEPATPTTPMYS